MNFAHLPLLAACVLVPLASLADPHKDESGHGKHRHPPRAEYAKYKETYWDGNCKVERKLGKNGDYKEKRKCKGAPRAPQLYAPAPVVVPAVPHTRDPGIVIHGTVRVN